MPWVHGLAETRSAKIGEVQPSTFELGTDGPRRILVGVDGSATSLRAGAYAAGLARRQGALLIVLYVSSPLGAAAAQSAAAVTAIHESHKQFAEQLRLALQEYTPRLGLESEFVAREGSVYGELVKLAEQRKVEAIVVGASMQAGHRLVGSLAAKLIRHAKWPVTVVP